MSFDVLHFTSPFAEFAHRLLVLCTTNESEIRKQEKKNQKLVLLSLQESKAQHKHVETEIKSPAFFFESLNLLVASDFHIHLKTDICNFLSSQGSKCTIMLCVGLWAQ